MTFVMAFSMGIYIFGEWMLSSARPFITEEAICSSSGYMVHSTARFGPTPLLLQLILYDLSSRIQIQQDTLIYLVEYNFWTDI